MRVKFHIMCAYFFLASFIYYYLPSLTSEIMDNNNFINNDINSTLVDECMLIYQKYEWLINSYVLDFYTENHWEKLPSTWKQYLQKVTPEELAGILNYNVQLKTKNPIPLSLLILRELMQKLNIPRNGTLNKINSNKISYFGTLGRNNKIMKSFWKHIKVKKQHEITAMSKITFDTANKSNCFNVVDIGSGLGHLARMLCYNYGLNVCGIEAQSVLSQQSQVLDQEFIKAASKHDLKFNENFHGPIHINKTLESTITSIDFYKLVEMAFCANESFQFGIVGLHPCGDLGATLLKLYKNCDNIRFINIVGCCYMKITTCEQVRDLNLQCFPLSAYYIEKRHNLAYNSREIACHAIETYINRLKNGEYAGLRIHSYRAMLEKILKHNFPELLHTQLNSVKYKDGLTFPDYCKKTLKRHTVTMDTVILNSREIQKELGKWMEVVVFYSLRLLFAPLVETIILFDRLLYLENVGTCSISAEFDPIISPRNLILTSIKHP